MLGRLNLVEGVFLGKEELNRQQKLSDNALKYLVRSFGSKGLFELKNNYTVTFNGSTLTFNGPKDILGVDTSQGVIYFNKTRTKSLADFVGTTVYISLSSLMETQEEGTVTLGVNGTLSGTGTLFTEILRSNYTKKGVKIYLHKTGQSFLIKSIASDISASVVETVAAEIVNSEWSVVGCFSPYASKIEANQQIYAYHTYKINVSVSIPNETSDFLIGKVTWTGGVPTFTWVQNRQSLLARNNSISAFDYIVDSDESLAGLRSNPSATNVLIKNGTYTYTSPDGRGLTLHPNTRLIWAESGSLIKVGSSVPAVANSFALGFTNIPTGEVQFYNLNVENLAFLRGFNYLRNMMNCFYKHSYNQSGSIGYYFCNNLYNCKSSFVNSIGIGFSDCLYLSTCQALGSATGFSACRSVSRCHSDSATGYATSHASRTVNALYVCADTPDGGFNTGSSDVPPPPVTNNNNMTLGILPDINNEAMLSVSCAYPVASAMNIEVLAQNSLGIQATATISLAIGDSYKTLVISGLTDPQSQYIYSILSASTTVNSDATYTYILNF